MAFNSFKSSTTQPMAEINTTPLVDVMLVLLVIFIITAPLFQQAISIDLPNAESKPLNDHPHVVHVTIDEKGEFFIEHETVSAVNLGAALSQKLVSGQEAPELHLRADRATRYEKITEVMSVANGLGVTKIAFVTEPEASK